MESANAEEDGADSQRRKKRIRNPWKVYRERQTRLRLERERLLLAREETMMEDLERYLMQLEEQHSWLAYHLNHVNANRMKKLQVIRRIQQIEETKDLKQAEENIKEDGLSFYQGNVQNYKRWQNSPAKYRDFQGHKDAVTSCRLSPCRNYILSCSADATLKIWDLASAECIKTMYGHTKVVNDLDYHPLLFKMYSITTNLISCSGDGTIRLWNTSDNKPKTTIYAHQSAVYRCLFAPDGNTIISCSEDKTIRTWNFPEGYNLFIYKAHNSPVSSIRYSQSGRYFASGSDYGERKILLWDAKLPHMYEPSKFPHIFFWTTTGLIKKILIRNETPRPGFWLAQNQLTWISSDKNLDIWPGELSDDDEDFEAMADDSDDDDDDDDEDEKEKKEKVDLSRAGDVYERDNVLIDVVRVLTNGSKESATEYNPGGSLIVRIQSMEYLLEDAFLDAFVKDSRFETYTADAGKKAGRFAVDAPVPWLPMKAKLEGGKKVFFRDPPPYSSMSKDGLSVIYSPPPNYHGLTSGGDDDSATVATTAREMLEIVWNCPEPLLGTVVIVFNFKLRDDNKGWKQLRYSMKESPIRMNEFATDSSKATNVQAKQFKFNQERRHNNFWNYIRDKEWEAAAGFIDKHAVAYVKDDIIKRRFRIMNLLVSMFEDSDWLILHSPFIFKPGVTKSVVLAESDYDDAVDEEGEEEGADEDREGNDQTGDAIVGDKAGEEDDRNGMSEEVSGLETFDTERLPPLLEEADDEDHESTKDDSVPQQIVSEDAVAESSAQEEVQSEEVAEENIGALEEEPEKLLKSSEEEAYENRDDNNMQDDGDDGQQDDWLMGGGTNNDNLRTQSRFRPRSEPMHLPQYLFTTNLTEESLMTRAAALAERETELVMKLLRQKVPFLGELRTKNQRGAVLALYPKPVETSLLDHEDSQNATKLLEFEKTSNDDTTNIKPVDYDIVMDAFDGLVDEFRYVGGLSLYHQSAVAKELQAMVPAASKQSTKSPLEVAATSDENFHGPTVKSGRYGPEVDDFSMPLPATYPIKAGHAKFALRPALEWYHRLLMKLKTESLPRTMEEVYEPSLRERASAYYHKLNKTQEKQFRAKLANLMMQTMKIQLMQENTYLCTRRTTHHRLPGLVSHYPNGFYQDPAIILSENEYPPPEKEKKSFTSKLFGRPVVKSVVVSAVGRKPRPELIAELQSQAYGNQISPERAAALGVKPTVFKVNILDNLIEHGEDNNDNGHSSNGKVSRMPASGYSEDGEGGFSIRRPRYHALENYPPTFFRERRGYYSQLPGLEDFAGSVVKEEDLGRIELFENAGASEDEDSVWEPPAGLLMRFRVNGFELAHHGAVNDIVFSPSELRLASAGGDALIKIWDPRDGSYVRCLKGHDAEVLSLRFTSSEQFLISAGGDAQIIIWSLLTQTIQRRMRGHVDIINCLDIVPDGSLLVSASHDHCLKTWCTTPRHPVAPDAPKIISFTERSVFIGWSAPPSFNCDITAFHFQQRVGTRGDWVPEGGQSLAPHLRNKVVENIIPATGYQFRICAENAMGRSDWGPPSPLVKTAFGLPEPVEKPYITRITRTTQCIVWFTPNPSTYGSAATAFDVQYSGNGKDYDGNPTLKCDLEEGKRYGAYIVDIFLKIRQRKEELKAKLIKSQQFNMRNRQTKEERKIFDVSDALSSETIMEILDRCEDETFLLVGCEVVSLRPGFLYTIRVRGSNRVGVGEWSTPTLSTATNPTIPGVPTAPVIATATLRSLTFRWDPPHEDGGTAITGYRLYLCNVDKTIELPRSSVTYTWTGLFPGRSYRCKVLAKNMVGESSFSELNAEDNSYTKIAPPDASQNPLAVAGSWDSLTFEVDVPYHNGSRVTHMEVEYRTVSPFLIGDWQAPLPPFSIADQSKDVEFVKKVDLDAQQRELEDAVRAIELAARAGKKSGASDSGSTKDSVPSKPPGGAGNKKGFKAGLASLEQEIEALIFSQRPVGHRIRFLVSRLEQDTMYELRARFVNSAGPGEYSAPCHRAKTNKAALPGPCAMPEIMLIGPNFLILELSVPSVEGGAPVRSFNIENMDLDLNATTVYRCIRNAAVNGQGLSETETFRMENLTPGHSYLLRCRVESAVGFGAFSPWTKEVAIPSITAPPTTTTTGGGSTTAGTTPSGPPTVRSIGSHHPLTPATAIPSVAATPSQLASAAAVRRGGGGGTESPSVPSSPATHSTARGFRR